jgi:hypothetical protein
MPKGITQFTRFVGQFDVSYSFVPNRHDYSWAVADWNGRGLVWGFVSRDLRFGGFDAAYVAEMINC